MESKKYPYTATQWHPEKNAYEWGDKLHIPHSKGAIDVTYAGAPNTSAPCINDNLHQHPLLQEGLRHRLIATTRLDPGAARCHACSRLITFSAAVLRGEPHRLRAGDVLGLPLRKKLSMGDGVFACAGAVASFFVDQARGNFHAPRDVLEEDDALIYGARLEFTGRHTSEDDAPW